MKKILCLLIISLLVYTIYYFNHTDKITYLSIGDSLSVGIDSNGNTNYGYSNYLANYLKDKDLLKSYNNYFSTSGTRIIDLKNKLETNWTIKKDGKSLSLKKCLREAELVTLSVGMDNILTELTLSTVSVDNLSNKEITTIVDKTIDELDSLFKELRKYAKEDIIFIGFYNPLEEETLTAERLCRADSRILMETRRTVLLSGVSLFLELLAFGAVPKKEEWHFYSPLHRIKEKRIGKI